MFAAGIGKVRLGIGLASLTVHQQTSVRGVRVMWKAFWNDEAGVILSTEMVLLLSILAIGMTAGLTTLRDGVITELADTGAAFGRMNQGFAVNNVSAPSSATAGSLFADAADFCDSIAATGVNSRCLMIAGPPGPIGGTE
jgi:Flp pilus assembly pilin Flp